MTLADKYLIKETAGGAAKRKFSRVFFGVQKDSERKIVLKSIARTDENHTLQDRLKSEAKFSFSSPYLPEVLDFMETENEIVLVLAYKEGIPLKDFAKQLKQKQKPRFIFELLDKLNPVFAELKEKKIIHLDIKPGNILISGSPENFEVSLIDFGMAKHTDEKSERSTLFPLGYAAPELVLNSLYLADQRTDIFSLGVTLWEVFTGRIPLLHPNPSITTNLQITHPLPEHDLVPKAYYQILSKMAGKHSFVKPPNYYSKEEMNKLLKDGMDIRYSSIESILGDWKLIPEKKKNWFGF